MIKKQFRYNLAGTHTALNPVKSLDIKSVVYMCVAVLLLRPFRRSRKLFFIKDFDNVFELGLLLLLTLLSILQIVEMDVLSTQRPLKIPTYMTVTTYIIVTLIAGALTFHQLATTWRDSITRRSRHTVESVYFGEDDTTCSDDILLVAHLSRCSSPQPPGAQGSPRPSGSHGLRHGTCSDGGRASFPNTRHKASHELRI